MTKSGEGTERTAAHENHMLLRFPRGKGRDEKCLFFFKYVKSISRPPFQHRPAFFQHGSITPNAHIHTRSCDVMLLKPHSRLSV